MAEWQLRRQMFEWCACGQGLSQSALSVDTSCPALSSFCLWGLASFYHVYRCWPMLYIILHHLTSKYPQLRGVIISNTILSGGIICAAWGRLIPHPSSPACSSKKWAHLIKAASVFDAVGKAGGLGSSTAGQIFLPHWGVSSALEVQNSASTVWTTCGKAWNQV